MSILEPSPFGESEGLPSPPPPPEPVAEIAPRRTFRTVAALEQESEWRMLTEEEDALLRELRSRMSLPRQAWRLSDTEDHPAPVPERIAGLSMVGGTTLIHAGYKVGKTVLDHNVVRSLADGTAFLNRFEVVKATGSIVIFDTELLPGTCYQWLDQQRIKNRQNVFVFSLRGIDFKPQRDADAEWMVDQLVALNAEVALLDPIAGVIKGDLNRGDVVMEFMKRMEEIKRSSVCCTDLFLTSHAGHVRAGAAPNSNERAAGHHQLMGRGDMLWSYTRGANDVRALSAMGRLDEDMPRMHLDFDPATKRLSFARWAGRALEQVTPAQVSEVEPEVVEQEEELEDRILDFIQDNPWVSGRTVDAEIRGNHEAVRKMLKILVDDDALQTRPGPRRATLYAITGVQQDGTDG